MILFSGPVWSADPAASAAEPDSDFVIVKYGSISVKTSEPGARVYVDDSYVGNGDSIIENIMTGEHAISCKTDDKTVTGTFLVRKNETLKLEARFDEGKLVPYRETATNAAETEKKKPLPVKHDKPRKQPEPKKIEPKNAVEERRKAYFNVVDLGYDLTDSQDVRMHPAMNPHVIGKWTVRKNTAGKYYRTKQGVLLCDKGPCEFTWTATFTYTDETGKADAFLMNWKETVFNGITPTGTSKQELECCLNGQCWKMQEAADTDAAQDFEIGRYRLSWAKKSVHIVRSDIMKEILDAGRSLSDYY